MKTNIKFTENGYTIVNEATATGRFFVNTHKVFIGTDLHVSADEFRFDPHVFNKCTANLLHGGAILIDTPEKVYKITYSKAIKSLRWYKEYDARKADPIYAGKSYAECFDIGKRIIDEVNTQRDNIEVFHDAAVYLAVRLLRLNINFTSGNTRVYLEAVAMRDTANEFNGRHKPSISKPAMPEELLHFYARAFGLSVSKTYFRTRPQWTANGFAMMQELTMDNKITYASADLPPYAGNLIDGEGPKQAPVTLRRDACYTEVAYESNALLQEQIEYYLSLPEETLEECFIVRNQHDEPRFVFINHVLTEVKPEVEDIPNVSFEENEFRISGDEDEEDFEVVEPNN